VGNNFHLNREAKFDTITSCRRKIGIQKRKQAGKQLPLAKQQQTEYNKFLSAPNSAGKKTVFEN